MTSFHDPATLPTRFASWRSAALVLSALLAMGARAAAADGAWSNATTNSAWSNTANWFNGVTADGIDSVAAFNGLDLTANRTVNLGANRTVGTLVFGDIVGSHNWTLANGTAGPWYLTLATSEGRPTISVENQVATISALLLGTQGFTKTGAGTLTLTGGNSLYGGIVLAQGTLSFAQFALAQNTVDFAASAMLTWNGTNTQDVSAQILVQDAVTATLNVGASAVTFATALQTGPTASATVIKAGAGSLTLTAANAFTGGFKVNVGRAILAGGNDRLATSGVVTLGQGVNAGVLQLGDATGASDQSVSSLTSIGTSGANAVVGGSEALSTLTISNSAANTYAGHLGGSGQFEDNLALTKLGSANLTLSGTSTFTGDVQIRGGSLIVTNASALGAEAKTITISGTTNAPSLQLNVPAGITLGAGTRFVTSNDQANAPAIVSVAGANVIAGPIALTGGGFANTQTRISVTGGTLALDGPISPADDAPSARTLILDGTAAGTVNGLLSSGPSYPLALTKAGTGNWSITAANTYTGATTINAGKLTITYFAANGTPQPLGIATSAILLGSNTAAGTLEYAGTVSATLGRNLTINGSAGGVLQNSSGELLTLSGTINKNARPLTFADGDFLVSGRITGGAATTALSISGGEVTFTNQTNSYGGPTIIAGGATLSLGANEVVPDASDLTLGDTLGAGPGRLALQDFSETLGRLSLAGDGAIDFGRGTGSAVSFASLGEHTGGTLSLWHWSGTPATLGSATNDRLIFSGDAAEFAAAYSQEQVSFDGVSGYVLLSVDSSHYEVVAAVPEPGSALLAATGGLLLLRARRRKN